MLDDHDDNICRALIQDGYSRCTARMDRDDPAQKARAAFCLGVVKQDASFCGRSGDLALDCRNLVKIRDLQDAASELEPVAPPSDTATPDTAVAPERPLTPGPSVVDAKGFTTRPTIVEDAFVRKFRVRFPEDERSTSALRDLFRSGARIMEDGELKILEGEPMYQHRQKEIAALRASSTFELDLGKTRVTRQQIAWMERHEAPLSFESPAQYRQFQSELAALLKTAGLKDAFVTLKGTATTFYSENPRKPLGHHFDANPKEPADLDLGLGSATLLERMAARGIRPSAKIPTIFRQADTGTAAPELGVFTRRWGQILGRPVNFVALTSAARPTLGKADYLVVGG